MKFNKNLCRNTLKTILYKTNCDICTKYWGIIAIDQYLTKTFTSNTNGELGVACKRGKK